MRTIERTTAFKRDYKREKKGPHGRQLDELIATVVTSLAKDEALAEALRDQRAGRPSALGTRPLPARCLAPRPRGACTSRGSTGSAVLGEQASHDDFAVLFGSGVLAITAVELRGHPFGKGPFVERLREP